MNIDATAMQQAGIGAGYIKNIINDRVASFLRRTDGGPAAARQPGRPQDVQPERDLVLVQERRGHHQPDHPADVVLTGAAVIREREHGTLEHLLVMPLTAFEIAMAKVWANSLVILVAAGVSLLFVLRMALKVPFAGSVVLWFVGVVLYLFFATALGIFLGTISRSMAQFALLIILVIVVLKLLSGGEHARREPAEVAAVRHVLLAGAALRRFSQVIIYRGGGLGAVWRQFLMVAAIGVAFFVYSLLLFRKSIAVTK